MPSPETKPKTPETERPAAEANPEAREARPELAAETAEAIQTKIAELKGFVEVVRDDLKMERARAEETGEEDPAAIQELMGELARHEADIRAEEERLAALAPEIAAATLETAATEKARLDTLPSHGLAPDEVDAIGNLVDFKPSEEDIHATALDKITRDSAVAVVDDGERRIKEARLALCEEDDDRRLLDQFKIVDNRASRNSHIVLCSANKEVDVGWLRDNLNQRTGLNSAEARAVDAVLERQGRLNGLLSQLYKCDTLRRIGISKQDGVYIDQGREIFLKLKDEVSAALDELEAADGSRFQAYPEARRVLAELRQALASGDADAFAEGFYAKITVPFSDLIGYDFDEFNRGKMIKNLKKIGR